MLSRLYIQNYAIIDEIDIHFSDKLNIITGETGAGKSIVMGALSLILGERADSNVLLQKDKKCYVEGYFKAHTKSIARFLKENDLDEEEQIIIRREIAVNGKSRAFINDTPVTVSQLQQLSSMLVDLHQQFDTLALGESDFQREAIDALAGTEDLLKKYAGIYTQLKQAGKKLADLRSQKDSFNKEADYHRFLYSELEDANFSENELEEADAELKLLSNSENIKAALTKVFYELSDGEQPLVQHLKQIANSLQSYTDYHPSLPSIVQRLLATQIELSDIADETESINDKVNHDPQRMEHLNERLTLGYKLLKKHSLHTTPELLALKVDLENKLQAALNVDEEIEGLEAEVNQLTAKAIELAEKISAKRKAQAKPFEDKVNSLLTQVGMPNARLKADITGSKEGALHEHGFDNIEFLFDANKSNRFAPVRKVASGGELSRLMLCIKSLVAASMDLPTMIFDEIDTGISGEAAKQVGVIMKELATSRQVISITHQPQIAGKADAHFFVYKQMAGERVKTNIRQLSKDERVTAIAKMLGGEQPSAAALENAREMVGV
ncbi:DNA repair protein RecN [Chitinophagaceae bacterium 26-R-25]|nr:DNA repair protein RecN [Chitinophagaceae bacterium 26-R-25]